MSFAGTPSISDSMPYRDKRKIHTNNLQGPARIILATNGKWVACIGAGRASLACAAELAKWGYAARIFDPNELPGVHPTYRTRRLRVSLSRVVPLRIASQISKREFAGQPDSVPKRFSLPFHSSVPADCKRLVPERHKSWQRQEERDCCDLCGSRSPPACLCLLSAVEGALRGRRDVRFKEDYDFPKACIEQWFVAVERQLQPDESADGQQRGYRRSVPVPVLL